MGFFSRTFNFFRIKKSLAIDLGTANTLIYDRQKKKIVLNEPSVVAQDRKTKKVIAVGKEAREMLGKTPDSIIAVKPLKDGVIADFDVTREMLRLFLHKIYGRSPFKPEVMICVPLEVTSVEKKALFDSITGAKKVYIIEEGRAAVLGSGVNISAPEGNMVIDIGGGSTDIAILSLDEIVVSKSLRIASNTFDDDIIKYVKKKYSLLIGERTAEKIKKELGTAIGLFASGVGAGSYVYLRRILERLVYKAKGAAPDAINNEMIERARVAEKIKMLEGYLPDILVKNTTIYGILSKGIHELSEEECRKYFPVVKECIYQILGMWESERRKQADEDALSKALSSISSSIK